MASELAPASGKFISVKTDEMPPYAEAFLVELLTKVAKLYSYPTAFIQSTLEAHKSGKHVMRLWIENGEPKAMYCVLFDKPNAVVTAAYSLVGSGPVIAGLEETKVVARKMGCDTIRFVTKRVGWKRRALQLGFAPCPNGYKMEI